MPRRKSTHVDSAVEVGRRLKEARERAGLSQRQLSFPGCSPAYISRIEAGDRIPSLQLLREMGRKLGVSEDYLATGHERHEETARLVDAELALRLDELPLASQLYEEALASAPRGEDRSRALAGLGQVAFRQGKPKSAIEYIEEARSLSRERLADQPAAADTLGRAYAMVDELEAAISIFSESLGVAEKRNDQVEAARFAVLLANAYIDASNFTAAEQLLSRAFEAAPDPHDPILRARLYWSHSRLHTLQNNPAQAARYARRALHLLEATEHAEYTARAHQLLAHIEVDREHPKEALDCVTRGLELLADSGNPIDRALLRLEEARALVQLGEEERAASLALEVSGLLKDASPHDAGRGYALVAQVYEQLGERARALELYELAAEVLQASPGRYLVEVYQRLAQLFEEDERKEDALAILKKAVAVRADKAG
ncbi:MAG: helix-turn-helix domain-containing protein [Gaiellaceae bacterium]